MQVTHKELVTYGTRLKRITLNKQGTRHFFVYEYNNTHYTFTMYRGQVEGQIEVLEN